MASQTAFLASTHHDLLTSLAFNALSPHLLATSSLDSQIRIHSRPPPSLNAHGDNAADEPAWEEVAAFKAHQGPVLRVRWAEGEWGDLLASCGSDGSVRIWDQTSVPAQVNGASGQPPRSSGARKWQQRACLIDARGSVRDVAFAPSDFGLHLASISADGFLRLYDCPDPSEGYSVISANAGANAVTGLSSWNLFESIDLEKLPLTATNSSSATAASSSAFTIYGVSGISLGGTSSSVPGPTSFASAAPSSSSGSSGPTTKPAGLLEADGGWTLSWCKESWYGECLACASGSSGIVRIFSFSPPSSWTQPLVLQPHSTSRSSAIASLDWAPGSGRSYQLIAAGHRDGIVRIWKVWPSPPPNAGAMAGESWRAELAAELTDHAEMGSGAVGRVEWNLTGTVLSTAGDDGKVRLWKATYAGEWRAVAVIACDEDPRSQAADAMG